jgi:hypothetical protein
MLHERSFPGLLNSEGYPSGGRKSAGSYGLYGARGGTHPGGLGLLSSLISTGILNA